VTAAYWQQNVPVPVSTLQVPNVESGCAPAVQDTPLEPGEALQSRVESSKQVPVQQNVPAPVSTLQVPYVASGCTPASQDTPPEPAEALQSRVGSSLQVPLVATTQQNVPAPVSALHVPNVESGVRPASHDTPVAPGVALQSSVESAPQVPPPLTQQNVPAPVSALQVPNDTSGVTPASHDTPTAPAVALQSSVGSVPQPTAVPPQQ
jgi:hypothetical protein